MSISQFLLIVSMILAILASFGWVVPSESPPRWYPSLFPLSFAFFVASLVFGGGINMH